MCSKLPATFALFPVLSFGYAHAQLSPLYFLSIFTASHVRKNTRLSTPAQLQCSCSRAWEPGNKGKQDMNRNAASVAEMRDAIER